MPANVSTVVCLGATLVFVTAGIAGLAGGAAAVPTHEPTDGGDDSAVLPALSCS